MYIGSLSPVIFSERKVDGRRFLFDASQGSEAIEQPDVLDAGTVVGEDGQRLQFLPSSLTQIEKLPLPVYAEETPAQEVGGDARGAAPGEGVENPSPGLCRGEDDAGQQGERFLRGVLALRLLPSGDGRKSPHVGHLLALVEELHQLVVVEMRHLLLLASPDDELGGVGEVSARDVGRWIGLRPGDDVEDFEAELCEFVGYGEDVVVSARHPDVPCSLRWSLQADSHSSLNWSMCSGVPPLSQSPLSTHTTFPLCTLMPPLERK